MNPIIATVLLTVIAGPFLLSLFEWTFHRYVMHRDLSWFGYPYERHAMIHHHIFRSDDSYHLQKESDKWTIPMAWWNIFPLFVIVMSPVALTALLMWILGVEESVCWTLLATSSLVSIAYYGMYEYVHWCMHLPRERRIEMSALFRRLNGHHILHHRYMVKHNFNVVFPFADWLFGTLLIRSQKPFTQVKGPSVPDLQPAQ